MWNDKSALPTRHTLTNQQTCIPVEKQIMSAEIALLSAQNSFIVCETRFCKSRQICEQTNTCKADIALLS